MRIRKTLRDLSNVISKWFPLRRRSNDLKKGIELTPQQLAALREGISSLGQPKPNNRASTIRNDQDSDSSDVEVLAGGSEKSSIEIEKAKDEWWRKNFKPHAVVICARKIPSSIVIYGMIGGERQRIIDFPERGVFRGRRLSPENYSDYVRENLPEEIPLMGKTIGYVVNYSFDYSIEYDLHGKVVNERNRFHKVADIQIRISNPADLS